MNTNIMSIGYVAGQELATINALRVQRETTLNPKEQEKLDIIIKYLESKLPDEDMSSQHPFIGFLNAPSPGV